MRNLLQINTDALSPELIKAAAKVSDVALDKEYGYILNVIQSDYEIIDYELGGQENEIIIIQSN